MTQQTIILTGFMGTGKSTVGRLLAERTGRGFIDTDELIVTRAGREIAHIFAESGEQVFREMEAEVAQELAGRPGLVIATGGRLMLDPANAAALGQDAHVVCLTATPAEILQRLADDGLRRPLLAVDDPAGRVRQLLQARAAAYARFRQVSTSGKSPAQVADEILAGLSPAGVAEPARLTVTHPAGEYELLVAAGLVGPELLVRLPALAGVRGPVAIVSDTNVGPLYAAACARDALTVVTVPAGEQHKTLDTVRTIYDQLLAAGLDRQGIILALGGGVVGDMAGFVAATYLRGVRLVQCPTTLLAMVDASIGGKTGVDLPQGKNLVGAFKQPEAVLLDVATLRTLPPAEFSAGLAEVVKHGCLAAPELLAQVAAGALPPGAAQWSGPGFLAELAALVTAAVQVKRDVVQADPFEQGARALLNLGHTFGHAVEQVSGYRVRHGEGVAMGLVAAANLSARLGYCRPALQGEIEELLVHCGLPVRIPAGLAPADLLAAMRTDKKRAAGRVRFVLLRAIGEAFLADNVPPEAVLATLAAVGRA